MQCTTPVIEEPIEKGIYVIWNEPDYFEREVLIGIRISIWWLPIRKLSGVVWSVSDKNETCSMLLPRASAEGN